MPRSDFPLDKDGMPLAWPDPSQSPWYIDAWNGVYSNRSEALGEVGYWVATEDERVLAHGETLIDEIEAERRRIAKPVTILNCSECDGIGCVHCDGTGTEDVENITAKLYKKEVSDA